MTIDILGVITRDTTSGTSLARFQADDVPHQHSLSYDLSLVGIAVGESKTGSKC